MIIWIPRHNQVVSCRSTLFRNSSVLIRTAPVCHHKALETPFAAKNISQQITSVGGVNAVQTVVTGHYSQRLRFSHNNLKTFEIDFPQCAFRNISADAISVVFRVVAAEMLDTYTYTCVRLDTQGKGSGHLSGEDRIFTVVLKGTAA